MGRDRITAMGAQSIYPEAARVFAADAERVTDDALAVFAVGWLEQLAPVLSDERLGEATRAVFAVIADRTRAGDPK